MSYGCHGGRLLHKATARDQVPKVSCHDHELPGPSTSVDVTGVCWGITPPPPPPPQVDPEEKDLLDSGLANSTRETSAQVQLGPGTQNPKKLPNKNSFTGGSKIVRRTSRTDNNDVVNEGYTHRMFKQDPIDES